MVKLGSSWDVVETVRSLASDLQSLPEIMVAVEARLQVLEARVAPAPLAGDAPRVPGPRVRAGGGK